jgi:hypothetical protein
MRACLRWTTAWVAVRPRVWPLRGRPFAAVSPVAVAPSSTERLLQTLEQTLADHPVLSTGVFVASDMVCVLGGSMLLQLAQVPLSPDWLLAATVSEALKWPVQAVALGVVTPLLVRLAPSLARIHTGSVVRAVYRSTVGRLWQSRLSADLPVSPPPLSAVEQFVNRYGAAVLVAKNLLSLSMRVALFGALLQGTDLTWLTVYLNGSPLADAAVKQLSYLTLSASLSVALLPLRLVSPALVVPTLVRLARRSAPPSQPGRM